ncbi:MAG TPA: hypothetical protein VF032_05660 [Thermoleophilaceae bacterium]
MASKSQTATPRRYLSEGERARTRPAVGARAFRYAGALALLAMGAIHLEQYVNVSYSQIPTIGTLFLLNFAGGLVLSIALMSPLERLWEHRGRRALILLALAGMAMAVASIVFLLISEGTPLFGFRESGYRPAIVFALAVEALAMLCLGAFVAAQLRRSSPPPG